MSDKGPILLLSIDGGGSRGVIPVNVLNHLEQETGVVIRDTFDFFAGVSTGAMVAAYIASHAGTIQSLAEESYSASNLSEIFDKSIWDKMLGRMQNQPKYDGLNKRAYFEKTLDDIRINDIKDKHLLILAYDFINRELITFKNNRGRDAHYNPRLLEVCDAASAAPTMYPPVPTSAPQRRWLVDGALAINDPGNCAISESLAMGYELEDIWMLSMGTGRPVHDLSQEDRDQIGTASRRWGVLSWLRNGLFDHMMSASSSVSAYQCGQLLGKRYLRINGELPRKLMQLDNTTEERIDDLKSYAFAWFEESAADFRRLLAEVEAARR
ncbi:MAG: patatin-like phospholipase family protein [Congregibacter sp.]